MKIQKEQVQHVAALARLRLSEDEQERLMTQMGAIIEFADQLNELDIGGVEATAQSLDIRNVFREDECKESFPRETILAGAPAQSDGCWTVPVVVE